MIVKGTRQLGSFRRGINLYVPKRNSARSGIPIPQSDLSLWLKADAGVTTTPETFISQVIISGGGRSEMDGTYTRASGGETSFVKVGDPNFEILWGGAEWYINGDTYYCESDESNQTEYAYNPSYDMSSNWLISSAYGCDGTPPTGSITLSPTGNSLVTGWADQSGNGNNATAYGNPLLISNQLNSKPVIYFDGSNWASFPISLSAETSRTIFIVGKYHDVSRQQEGFIALGNSELEPEWDRGYVFRADGVDGAYYYTPGQIAAPTFTSIGNYHIETISHIEAGDSVMGINGSFGDALQISLSAIDKGLIASRDTSYEQAIVSIAEIIIYNRALTTAERQQVEEYLNAKYYIIQP